MGFEQRNINGILANRSNKVLQWKIVHSAEKIIYLSCDAGETTSIHSCYSAPNFRNIMNYIKNNNLDVQTIELTDKENFINNVVGDVVLPNDQDLIDFCNALKFTEDANDL